MPSLNLTPLANDIVGSTTKRVFARIAELETTLVDQIPALSGAAVAVHDAKLTIPALLCGIRAAEYLEQTNSALARVIFQDLECLGVRPIPVVRGDQLDLASMEIAAGRPSADAIVLDVLQEGFRLDDRLIRKSTVAVGPAAIEPVSMMGVSRE